MALHLSRALVLSVTPCLVDGALEVMRENEERGSREPEVQTVEVEGGDNALYLELPENWLVDADFPDTNDTIEAALPNVRSFGGDNNSGGIDAMSDGSAVVVPRNGNEVNDMSQIQNAYCQSHTREHKCYLYAACHGRSYCVMGNYMIVAGFPCPGMESINGGNAGSFDFLMSAARARCSSQNCVLITNPVGHRTQEQLHIHYRYYNGGGAHLKRQLERTLCGTHGWRHFHSCGHAQARLYSGFPGVFSAVAAAYGGGSLANVGISVWSTTACGGYKYMILATTHCSIEHSISSR